MLGGSWFCPVCDFMNKETEAQRGKSNCFGSHSMEVAEPRFKSSSNTDWVQHSSHVMVLICHDNRTSLSKITPNSEKTGEVKYLFLVSKLYLSFQFVSFSTEFNFFSLMYRLSYCFNLFFLSSAFVNY